MNRLFIRKRVRNSTGGSPPPAPWDVEAPRTLFLSTYTPRTGTVRTVNSGGDLQAAVDAAVPGDHIVLENGAVFQGLLNLPDKTGSGEIYVTSAAVRDGVFTTPLGQRVTSSAGMATIRHVGSGTGPIMQANGSGRTGWRFDGIQFDLPTGGSWSYSGGSEIFDLIRLGDYSNSGLYSSVLNFPGNFTFDRCRVIGRRDVNVRRGISFAGPNGGVFNSQMLDVNTILPIGDCVGIICWVAAGNIHIYNTEIEGPTEHVMPGGVLDDNWNADTQIVPYDITVDRCYLRGGTYQDEAHVDWNGSVYNTKNMMETKAGLRIRFSNILTDRHLGKDNQYVMTIKSNGGGGLGGGSIHPCRDISIENIKMLNYMGGIQFRGIGSTPDNPIERVRVRNVGMAGHRTPAGNYTVSPRSFQLQDVVRYLDIAGVTSVLTPGGDGSGWATFTSNAISGSSDIRITDSVLGATYGIGYAGAPYGGIDPLITGEKTLARLGLISPSSTDYGSASNIRVADAAAAQFVSYANATTDNLRLQAGSPLKGIGAGGADPGCDWNELDAATAGCISGVWA